MRAPFVKGDRVQASETWLDRSKYARVSRRTKGGKTYDPARLGTVMTDPRGACVKVHWDGNAESSVNYMHYTFLVKV